MRLSRADRVPEVQISTRWCNRHRCDAEISSVVISRRLLIQIVHFHESNSRGVIQTAHDRGVVTWLQLCNDCRFAGIARSVAAVRDGLDLTCGDNPADYCVLPVIIGGYQGS